MRLHRSLRLALQVWAAALLAACSGINVVSDGGDENLVLEGSDPVAYFAAGRALAGRTDLKAEHRGLTYRFVNEETRRIFVAAPDRFIPQYGGLCAGRMVFALPVAARNEHFKIIGGKLYLFSSAAARQTFEMDQERNLRLAEHYWEAEVRDANWHLQSWKRQLWRVPHYRSVEQLAEEYEKRFGKKPG